VVACILLYSRAMQLMIGFVTCCGSAEAAVHSLAIMSSSYCASIFHSDDDHDNDRSDRSDRSSRDADDSPRDNNASYSRIAYGDEEGEGTEPEDEIEASSASRPKVFSFTGTL
jgi:hypothetical protein